MAVMNNSPLSCLSQITSKLWNTKFLSDVEFKISGRSLYGHSILLMCRSLVFEEIFAKKHEFPHIIPIENTKYEHFSDFLGFLYKDDCLILETNSLELLQLAIKYKVPKLENKVLSYITMNYRYLAIENKMKLLEFCLVYQYELLYDWMNDNIAHDYNSVIHSEYFLKLQPQTVEHILKFGYVTEHVSEFDIFQAVLKWMNIYCQANNIALGERRKYFNDLIHLIRFPVMTISDFSKVIKSNKDLFSDAEFAAFFDGTTLETWNSNARVIMKPREKLTVTVNFPNGLVRYIKSKIDLLFVGIWLGCVYDLNGREINMNVVISPYQSTFDFPMGFRLTDYARDYIISFGESLLLKGHNTYSIRIHFLDPFNHRNIDVDRYSPLLKQKLNSSLNNHIEVNDHGNLGNIFKLYFKIPKTKKKVI